MKISRLWVASKDKNHFRVFEYDLDDSILLKTFIELKQWDDVTKWLLKQV